MEPSFVTPLALLLLSTLIGVVIRQNAQQATKTDKLGESVNDLKVTHAGVAATVATMTGRVDDLHKWKNAVQERETTDLRNIIEDMRRKRVGDE
jgi:hypothetical protein